MWTAEKCTICGHGPVLLKHLYDHLRKSHSWSKTQIDEEKLRIRAKKADTRCDICHKFYSTLKSLRHHKQRVHLEGTSSKLICPECGQKFNSHRELAKHCAECHTLKPATQDFSIITGEFDSYAAFEKWKESMEISSLMNFTKRYATPCKDNGTQHFFFCKNARGEAILAPPPEGAEEGPSSPFHSEWYPAHCPAFLKVLEKEDGSVTYEGCIGHLGHGICPSKVPIPKNDEEEILSMLREGLQEDEIVAKILEEKWDHSLGSDRQARICYVEEKDVWRIAHRHGLVEGKYRPPKKPTVVEENSKQTGPDEEVLPGVELGCRVEEVIDLTESGDEMPEPAPMSFRPMQRVDTAAIEAFQSFQEINRFVNELMELCVKSNQHELISQMNSAMMTKASEIAGTIGVNTENFLERIPTLTELVASDLQGKPAGTYTTVSRNGQEHPETKPRPDCESQSSLEDVMREECGVVDINSVFEVKREPSSCDDEVIIME